METKSIPEYVWVVTAHTADNNPIISVYFNEEKARETYMQWLQICNGTHKVTLTKSYLFT